LRLAQQPVNFPVNLRFIMRTNTIDRRTLRLDPIQLRRFVIREFFASVQSRQQINSPIKLAVRHGSPTIVLGFQLQ
jgi:hypothetical protein